MIRLIDGQGFELTFKNGSSIAIFWGYRSMSQNENNCQVSTFEPFPGEVESQNCEIRCYSPTGCNITNEVFKVDDLFVSWPSTMIPFAMVKLQNYDDNYESIDSGEICSEL